VALSAILWQTVIRGISWYPETFGNQNLIYLFDHSNNLNN
jgi:hypothetical protein